MQNVKIDIKSRVYPGKEEVLRIISLSGLGRFLRAVRIWYGYRGHNMPLVYNHLKADLDEIASTKGMYVDASGNYR